MFFDEYSDLLMLAYEADWVSVIDRLEGGNAFLSVASTSKSDCTLVGLGEGDTLIHIACSQSEATPQIIDDLVRMGADLRMVNSHGHTPRDIATLHKNLVMVRHLDEVFARLVPESTSAPKSGNVSSPRTSSSSSSASSSDTDTDTQVERDLRLAATASAAAAAAASAEHVSICIGDIHGCLARLLELWALLQVKLSPIQWAKAYVFFLGDYVDRGPDSRGVLEFLSSLQRGQRAREEEEREEGEKKGKEGYNNQRYFFLAGNHEIALQTFLGGSCLPLHTPADLSPTQVYLFVYLFVVISSS